MTLGDAPSIESEVANAFEFIHALPVGICALDNELRVVAWNHNLVLWTGVTSESILGDSILAHFPNLDHRGVRLRLEEVLKSGAPCIFSPQLHQRILPHKDVGARSQVQSTTVTRWSPSGSDQAYAIMAIQDVTELYRRIQSHRESSDNALAEIEQRRLIEHALLHSRERLQTITDAIPALIAHCNMDDQFVFVNTAYEELYDLGRAAIMGARVCDILGEEMYSRVQSHIEAAKRGATVKVDIDLDHQAYGSKTFRISLSPQFSDKEQIRGFYMFATDITAEKDAERSLHIYTKDLLSAKNQLEDQAQELRAAREAAEATMRSKTFFLANMTHEIRTPMTAILGYADMMTEELLDDATRNEYLAIIRRNGDHLLALINDILDFSKDESNALELEKIPCSPRTIIEDVATLLKPRIISKGLDLDIDLAPDIPIAINSDPTRIKQILMNLASNAAKFTESGSVGIRAFVEGSRTLQIDITDTGIGIEEDAMERVFELFQQADDSTNRKYGGTGLGLAISRNLAEALGGGIAVTSKPTQGSTFSVTLDMGAESERPSTATPQEVDSKPDCKSHDLRPHTRVLLAEDGEDNRRLITAILERAGAQVESACNGKIACDMALDAQASKTPYDLILMDMQMPEVDGLEATRLLRSRGYTHPIVALTANIMPSDRSACHNAGCDDFESKPINRKRLLATVNKFTRD